MGLCGTALSVRQAQVMFDLAAPSRSGQKCCLKYRDAAKIALTHLVQISHSQWTEREKYSCRSECQGEKSRVAQVQWGKY